MVLFNDSRKMKRKINSLVAILIVVIALLSSCCKDDAESYAFLIGNWSIERIDSCIYAEYYDSFAVVREIPGNGTFTFSPDRTGEVHTTLTGLSGTENAFIWDYNAETKMIDFNFQRGTTVGLILESNNQELNFYFREYLTQPHFNTRWYKLQLSRSVF